MSDLVNLVRHLIPEGLVPGEPDTYWRIRPGYTIGCRAEGMHVWTRWLTKTLDEGKWCGIPVVPADVCPGDPAPVWEWCQKYGATVCADHGWVVVTLPEPLFWGADEDGDLDTVVSARDWDLVYTRLTTEVMRWEVVGP